MSTDVPLLLVVVTVAATGGSYVVGIPPASYDVAMAPGRRVFLNMVFSAHRELYLSLYASYIFHYRLITSDLRTCGNITY